MNKKYAFTNCNVINGQIGIKPESNMVILVNDEGIIEEIGKMQDVKIPADYEIINIANKYILPGLINAHVHLLSNGGRSLRIAESRCMLRFIRTRVGKNLLKLYMKKFAINALHSGVTTLRCVGDLFYKDVEIRDEIDSKKYVGPKLVVSGYLISITGGHGASFLSLISDSPWEARKCVRENIKNRVDLIKICVTGGVTDARVPGEAGRLQMTEEEVTAVCDEAHKIGKMVAAHAESKEGVRVALRGGVDTIEHGSEMDDEIISLFKNNPKSLRGTSALIPTIHAALPLDKLNSNITKISPITKANSSIVYNNMLHGLRQAVANGIRIGLGTDASMPYVTHYNTWRELDYLIKYAEVTPEQAIYFATKSNAEIIGIDNDTGSIDVGKSADFIVVDSNPLKEIRTLARPRMVIAKGNMIHDPSIKKIKNIDELLDSIQ